MTSQTQRDFGREMAAIWDESLVWRPIKTAPKDGSRFLAWVTLITDEENESGVIIKRGTIEKYAVVAYYALGGFVEFPWRGSFVQGMRFTHWMPLPEPPKQ